MAKVFPFRGIRYDVSKAGDLSRLVTQPYDKIDKALMEKYYGFSDYNFTRIIKAKSDAGDDEYNNKYTRAREFIKEWMDHGVLRRDDKPSLYVYHRYIALRVRRGSARRSSVWWRRNVSVKGLRPTRRPSRVPRRTG